MGLGIIAWAIAATGDTLARAYAQAHVTRTKPDEDNQPAIQTAAIRLADAYAVAHVAKINAPAAATQGTASTATTPVYSPPTPAASTTYFLAFSPPLKVKTGARDGEAIAVQVKSEGGKVTQQYQVGTPGSTYGWVVEDAVSMPSAAPATTSPATPATPGVTAMP